MVDRVGQQLGHYRLLRVLGQGTFATVYLGEHLYLERPAAIKVLHIRMEAGTHESFRREARTIAQLRHPHIIGVYDFGIENQTPYLVMEYTPNGTLRSRYPKGTRLPFEQIVTSVKQIASALDYAHEQHVIHRDVKPENILLGMNEEVVLSDFGIAVVHSTLDSLSMHNPAGTPIYMAPEQIQHKPCAASDQYALGVMVYEWLCGEPPFHGQLFEVLSQHLHKSPPSLHARISQLPPAVEDAVFGALAKDPAQRFTSITDFATALEEAFFATQPLRLHDRPQDQTALLPSHSTFSSVSPPHEQDLSDDATQPRLKAVQRVEQKPEPILSASPRSAMHHQQATKQRPALRQQAHASALQNQNRVRMLRRLRHSYHDLMSQSLQGTAWMELDLADKPDAVQNPAHLLLRLERSTEELLPADVSIKQAYDEAAHELLILGEPGAGKSTLLLDLAQELVLQAEQDETHPLPIILPLSSWAAKRQPLQEWIAEQLAQIYNVPHKLSVQWAREGHILPLLDGLDEMEETARRRNPMKDLENQIKPRHMWKKHVAISACIGLIFGLSFGFDLHPGSYSTSLTSVRIYNLSDWQRDGLSYGLGIGLGSLLLQHLLTSPENSATRRWKRVVHFASAVLGPRALLLAVVIGLIFGPGIGLICGLSYALISLTVSTQIEDIHLTEHWRDLLNTRYIRRTVWLRYIRRTVWLRWQQMSRLFKAVQGSRVLLVAVIIGLNFGLSAVLRDTLNGRVELMYELDTLIAKLRTGLMYGLSYALISLVLSIQMTDIHLTERIRWTWNSLRRGLFNARHLCITALLICISIVLIGLSGGLSIWNFGLINAWILGLINGLSIGLSYWFLFGLFQGIAQERIENQDRRVANQGIRHSLRNSVIMGIVEGAVIGSIGILIYPLNIGLGYGLIYGLLQNSSNYALSYWLNFGLSNAPSIGLVASISGALLTCMLTGGLAVWQHYIIRLLLWHAHTFPWKAPQFLNDATARFLLRRVGGGYSFSHRLLLDHLADATEDSTELP